MEPLDLLVLDHRPLKDEWRYATITSGVPSVMTHGTIWMLVLLVSILATAMKVNNYSSSNECFNSL